MDCAADNDLNVLLKQDNLASINLYLTLINMMIQFVIQPGGQSSLGGFIMAHATVRGPSRLREKSFLKVPLCFVAPLQAHQKLSATPDRSQ